MLCFRKVPFAPRAGCFLGGTVDRARRSSRGGGLYRGSLMRLLSTLAILETQYPSRAGALTYPPPSTSLRPLLSDSYLRQLSSVEPDLPSGRGSERAAPPHVLHLAPTPLSCRHRREVALYRAERFVLREFLLWQVRKNCGSKKSKVQKLGRAGERVGTPLAVFPSGAEKLLSQALTNVTKTYVATPAQD
jgi:hypothetical protein